MPDRLPSLVVLAAFWVPPAIAGWVAAGRAQRIASREKLKSAYAALALFVLAYAAVWFAYNVGRMPPYIPGATMDPTVSPPRAVAGLALFTCAFVLPGSGIACAVAFRRRMRAAGGQLA